MYVQFTDKLGRTNRLNILSDELTIHRHLKKLGYTNIHCVPFLF